jgi:hypothetical protein
MNLAAIHGIGMFVVRPERSIALYFDGFRLQWRCRSESGWSGGVREAG